MAKLIPLIGAAVVALIIGGGAGWFYGNVTAPKTVIIAEEKPHIVEYAIKDRVVNLADQGGRRYLKVSMVIQVAEQKAKAHAGETGGTLLFLGWEQPVDSVEATGGGEKSGPAVIANEAQVHDAITTVLSSKRSEEVMSNEGRERLREGLKAKLNTVLPKDQQVVKILFTDFIIQ